MSAFDDYRDLCEERDSLRAELAELRARVKEVPRTTEWHIAMREANQIHDADAYFAARSEMLDSGHNRHLFEAGYQRGFDAGEKVYAGTAAAAVPDDVAKDALEDLADTVSLALSKAWSLGQTYWSQADSESYKQNKKAAETQQTFNALTDATRATILAAKEKGK